MNPQRVLLCWCAPEQCGDDGCPPHKLPPFLPHCPPPPRDCDVLLSTLAVLEFIARSALSGARLHDLHVPDGSCVLVPAAWCYFNDSPWIAARVGGARPHSGGAGGSVRTPGASRACAVHRG